MHTYQNYIYIYTHIYIVHIYLATHSSILAWKIPWTEEPGWLLFMGSQRVGHDWATSLLLLSVYIVHIGTICVCVCVCVCVYNGIDLARLPSRWGCFSPAPSFLSPHTIPPPLSHMYMSKAKAFFEKMSQTLNYFTSVWNLLRVSPFSSFPAFGILVLTEK